MIERFEIIHFRIICNSHWILFSHPYNWKVQERHLWAIQIISTLAVGYSDQQEDFICQHLLKFNTPRESWDTTSFIKYSGKLTSLCPGNYWVSLLDLQRRWFPPYWERLGPGTQYLRQRTSETLPAWRVQPTVHTARPGDISPLIAWQTLHTDVVLAEVTQKSVPFTSSLALKAHVVSVRGRVGRVPGRA